MLTTLFNPQRLSTLYPIQGIMHQRLSDQIYITILLKRFVIEICLENATLFAQTRIG